MNLYVSLCVEQHLPIPRHGEFNRSQKLPYASLEHNPAVGNSQSQTAPTRTTAPREADSLKDFFCITKKNPLCQAGILPCGLTTNSNDQEGCFIQRSSSILIFRIHIRTSFQMILYGFDVSFSSSFVNSDVWCFVCRRFRIRFRCRSQLLRLSTPHNQQQGSIVVSWSCLI